MNTTPLLKILGMVTIAGIAAATPSLRAATLNFSVCGLAHFSPASKANSDADVTDAVNDIVGWYNGGANPNGGAVTFALAPGS